MALDKLQILLETRTIEEIINIPKKIVEVFVFNIKEYKELKESNSDSPELKLINKQLDMLRCSNQTVGHITYKNEYKVYFKSTNWNNKITERKIAEYIKELK